MYYALCCDRMYLDKSMKAGDIYVSRDKSEISKVISTDETVSVKCGTFKNCLHIHKTETNNIEYDIWYAPKVGIV